MKSPRIWLLLGAAFLLGLWYVNSFTEWLRPEPIEIIAQFRPLPKQILARRNSERSGGDNGMPRPPGTRLRDASANGPVKVATVGTNVVSNGSAGKGGTNSRNPAVMVETRGGQLALGMGRGGGRNLKDIQPFVFSLDARYRLTSVKVIETSSTNSQPPVTWWVRSKIGSAPTDNVLYGKAPDPLTPSVADSRPEKLLPGKTYTLFVEAGRRRGQKSFSVPQEAEPVPPDDGDYHPEKDMR